jgi:hypothetical protein
MLYFQKLGYDLNRLDDPLIGPVAQPNRLPIGYWLVVTDAPTNVESAVPNRLFD